MFSPRFKTAPAETAIKEQTLFFSKYIPYPTMDVMAKKACENVGSEPAAHPERGQHAADRSDAVAFHGVEF